MTVRDWSEQWLREGSAHWKRRTERNYRSRLRCDVWPVLGDVALDAVDRRMLRALLLGLRERGLATSTIRLVLATMRAMFQVAVEAEVLRENPALRLGRLVAQRRDAQAVHCPTQAAVAQVLDIAQRQYPRYFPLFLCLARTGLRIGEACGLRWEDVDLERRIAHVRRTVGDGSQQGMPKSGRGRDVDLSAALVVVLRNLPRDGVWVFRRTTTDSPIDQRLANEALRDCARAAGIEGYLTCHGLRHAYASALVSLGVSLEYIARQLGHSSSVLISTVYGRHLPAHHPAHVDLLD